VARGDVVVIVHAGERVVGVESVGRARAAPWPAWPRHLCDPHLCDPLAVTRLSHYSGPVQRPHSDYSTAMQRSQNDFPASSAGASPAPGAGYSWAVVGMLWFICFFNYA